MKDYTGNSKSIYVCIGASNHSDGEREKDDYYATSPEAVERLLRRETFSNPIWECACGGGHISKVLIKHGYNVYSSDIIDRGYTATHICDFLKETGENGLDIVTNPPYKIAKEFVEHALDISNDGVKVAMFLKLTFLEGQARRAMFRKYPPKTVYVSPDRLNCAKGGKFEDYPSSAVAYAWFIWIKGFKGDPVIKWL